ncbi:MAG: alpha-ketoacid dehydrogenase subunit beta, partial [Tissierellia bacterium]|nr:alpha-ketoacid dehydrogenase subunit beta [Tissierellia bacterium]
MGKQMTLAKAIEEAIKEEMRLDSNVLMFGQDVRQGGSWGTSASILEEFGPERIFPLGITENGFAGMATGLAMTGKRPVVEFMFGDFMLLAMDSIVDQAAKYAYQSGPKFNIPAVFRLAGSGIGGTFGLHHAQAPDSW